MNSKAIADYIVNWLKTYAEDAGVNGFVVGVSGGIDSAVTSSLAARTGLATLCVEMPIHQSSDQVTCAAEHIEKLQQQFPNVSRQEVELTAIFDALIQALPQASGDRREMALVNSRARLRMTTLYYFAGLHNYLVTGTGNKVEDFGVGFYTKYGDGGVDLSPIADLNKTEVYALGKEMGVIERIMQAPPTDGLWGDDRTDEDQIGATYPELEWAMEFQADGKDPDTLEGREREVYEIYIALHKQNKHKMEPIPVCSIPTHLKI